MGPFTISIEFIPSDQPSQATDKQLIQQLIAGLCRNLQNPKEENSDICYNGVNIPYSQIKRLCLVLAQRFDIRLNEDGTYPHDKLV